MLAAVLAWQAVAAAVDLGRRAATRGVADYGERLCNDTEARMRRVVGDDVAIHRLLRERVPPGELVLTPKVHGSIADVERLAARNGRLLQLTHLLYPDPFLCSVADAVRIGEGIAAHAAPPWLLLLQGDAAPEGRPGWRCEHRDERCQLWRFQKD